MDIVSNILQNIIELNSTSESNSLLIKHYLYSKNKKKRTIKLLLKQKKKIPKVKDFIKTINEFPETVFRSHFRMRRDTLKVVIQELKPFWKIKKTGRPKLKLETALLLTIWRLSTGCTFREISNLFGVGKGATVAAFLQITNILFNLRTKFIRWPSSDEEQRNCADSFQNLRTNPFPFVMGCIDGSHIQISKPLNDAISYFNRKQFYSVILQGVCDSKLRFIDAFVGYPGSCHDAVVWEYSPLLKDLREGKRKLMNDTFLLGDSAYPLSNWVIVPFRDNGFLTEGQKRFNFIHSSTRVSIEQAFGRLKGMFRILKFIDMKNIKYVKQTVMACIVLHNLIIEMEGSNSETESFPTDTNVEVNENIETNNSSSTESGNTIRDRLMILFSS